MASLGVENLVGALILLLLPFVVIWLWDVWDEWKIDKNEDEETLLLTGELSEGMTRDGEITTRWNWN